MGCPLVDTTVDAQKIAKVDVDDSLNAEIAVCSNVDIEGCVKRGPKEQTQDGTKVGLSIGAKGLIQTVRFGCGLSNKSHSDRRTWCYCECY